MNASRYFKLGLFVLIGVALLVGTIIAIGTGSFAKTVRAETYVQESVVGLEAGSAVKYQGVTVGRVRAIRFAASEYSATAAPGQFSRKIVIEMSLNGDVVPNFSEAGVAKMVQEGLRATIVRSVVTGVAYVGLDFFSPSEYPPAAITWRPQGVYIPAVTSMTTEIATTVEGLMRDIQQADLPGVLKRFDTLLIDVNKSVNELKLSEVREQAVALLSEVRGTNARLKMLLDDPKLQTAIGDLPDITGRLKTSLSRADEILHDKRVEQTLAGMSDAAASAGPAAVDARRVIHDLRALVASQQDDLRTIITDLRASVTNLNVVTEDAKANPSRLLFGQPPPRKKPGE